MEYFQLIEDYRLTDRVRPLALQKEINIRNKLNKENAYRIKDTIITHVAPDPDNEFSDYIEFPAILINSKMENIIRLYQPDIIMKTVIVASTTFDKYKIYKLLLPNILACAAEESTYYKDRTIKNLVLDKEKTNNNKIFLVEDYQRQLIVTLEVAESILRRRPIGLELKKINTI